MLLLLLLSPGDPVVVTPDPPGLAYSYYSGGGYPAWDYGSGDYFFDACGAVTPDYVIDPDSTQRVKFSLAAELDGDTITDAEIVLDSGLTVTDVSFTDSTVTTVVSGATLGQIYRVTARYTTSSGQILDKTHYLLGRNT